MGRSREIRPIDPLWRVLALVATCLLFACAGPGAKKSGTFEVRKDGGFTITEQMRFGSDVRGDFRRALEHLEDEEYQAGIELLEKVVEAAPQATAAHIDLGIALRTIEEYERAEASMLAALALNPRHPAALNELGIVYRKMGRFEDARQSYERALSVFPDFHFARRNLAILCDVYLGDIPCAVEHYELYAQMVPEDEKVVMWITDLRNRMGK